MRNARSFGCGVAAGIAVGMALGCLVGGVLWAGYRSGRAHGASGHAAPATDSCPADGDERVTRLLKPIRQAHRVPAMAGLILTSDGVQGVGVVGVRKQGEDTPATVNDLWHLGSETKAMTAAVMARLVERGALAWDTPIAELFPELESAMHEDMKRVTPLHLLSHRAGLPTNPDLGAYRGEHVQALRLRALREELAKQPLCEPGSETRYSNLGYILAGALIERTTGLAWEEVIEKELFAPLDMQTAGFGGTGTPGQLDQPWGHGENGRPVSGNGPSMDNPPVMGPAGRVHCTIQDWARLIQDQLRGSRGADALLFPASYDVLHTPPFGGDYALGWSVAERAWGGGTVFTHCGDNTMNFANVWIAPERDVAVLVCVNQGSAFTASDEAVGALIDLHLSTQGE